MTCALECANLVLFRQLIRRQPLAVKNHSLKHQIIARNCSPVMEKETTSLRSLLRRRYFLNLFGSVFLTAELPEIDRFPQRDGDSSLHSDG